MARLEKPPGDPQVRAVHHVSFRVDELESALDFYERILGCERRPRPDLGFRGAWLQLGDVQIHLLEVPADVTTGYPASEPNLLANHLAFGVPDLPAFGAYLEREGFPTTRGPTSLAQLVVQDPSGNVIEFTSA